MVAGTVTTVTAYDEGRLGVARVRVDRVLKGTASGDLTVVERHDMPSSPDLLRSGDHVLLFLAPAARSSSLTQALPPGTYTEPVAGRAGVITGDAAAVAEAADLVARMVAAGAAPEKDRARRAAQARALVMDEIGARHPRLVAEGAAALPGVPDLAATLGDDERRRLEAALAREDLPSYVRVVLVEAVGGADLVALAPALRTLPRPDPAVQAAAWEALRRLGQPPTVADLTPALASPDPALRAAAATALAGTAGRDAIPQLERLALEDPSTEVRDAAIAALGSLRGPEALPALERIWAASDWPQRQAAGRAISRIGGRSAQEAFARLAFVGQPDAEKYAVTLLMLTGVSRDDELVTKIRTTHPDDSVRALATEGLPRGEH